jgi:hypothetical protein
MQQERKALVQYGWLADTSKPLGKWAAAQAGRAAAASSSGSRAYDQPHAATYQHDTV